MGFRDGQGGLQLAAAYEAATDWSRKRPPGLA
jgi:hypothetical protein